MRLGRNVATLMLALALPLGGSPAVARPLPWPQVASGVTPAFLERLEMPLRDQILALAAKYGERTDVPYVWGGNAIGDAEQCQACRECIDTKRSKGKQGRLKNRLKTCPACKSCGIDCSHFAQRFFGEAGLTFPYKSTSQLRKMTAKDLREKLGLVDLGNDLRLARPGDILLHTQHMTILLKLHSATHGDVLHASRSYKKGRIGGIEIARDKNLLRFRGRLLKVLRRVELMDGPPSS